MDDIDRRWTEIAELWNRVERRAKEVEQFRGEAIIAAINEMRYAGRRVVDVIASQRTGISNSEFTDLEQLAIAKNFLNNADHDLTDGVLFYAHNTIQRTIERHGVKKITRYCPEFGELYGEMDAAHRIVTGSREDRLTRKAEYDRLADDYIPKIIALHKKLIATKKLRIDRDMLAWWLWVVSIIAFVGSVASVGGIALSLYQIHLAFHPPIIPH
ncbi:MULTISPECIES: hypothetical protein [unclassified Mesorhizobium]|uniref:hypothetical protein n=1 Tax=unclassified Mesorhizobium TaxID=325217 RepID=UPI0033397037